MNKLIRNSLSSIILLVLSACNLFGPPSAAVFDNSVLRLTVQTQNNVSTFGQAGEVITYQYVITNTGTPPLGGPVIVTDNPRQVVCPALATVGNQDTYLDQNETITCSAPYLVTQSDVTTGTIVSNATATAGNISSNAATLTLTLGATPQPSNILRLTKTASSQTYGAADQTITYTFTITNTGATPLGPAQFTINDPKLGAPFNCGPADSTLAPNQGVTCSIDYKTTTADMSLANITNSATAAGAGQTSAAATAVVVNLLAPATQTPQTPATAQPSSNLSPGSTIQHQVAVGEWLIQIGRCYGANFEELRNANPQIANPNFILPAMVVTVPRIGSAGKIYGPPCITFHTVQSGDTWTSLAQRYNADQAVLQLANPGGLVVGKPAKIPLNSAGGGQVVVTPGTGATFTPTSTGTTSSAPMRITFDQGSTTASRIGLINPNERIQYIVTAAAGQLLTINIQANANQISVGVNNPNGLALKTPDSLYTWSTTVTTAGDHTINLASLVGTSSVSYTLQVSLTNPTTPATPTNTPSTPLAP
jgi:uncharacterized repeat protein (TIGR01451 family)